MSEPTDSSPTNGDAAGDDEDFVFPDDWVTAEALANLVTPRTPVKQLTTSELVAKTFEDNALDAAGVIVDIALTDPSSSRRLSAAKYIVDRLLGPVSQAQTGALDQGPFEILKGLLREPTAEERQNGKKVQ